MQTPFVKTAIAPQWVPKKVCNALVAKLKKIKARQPPNNLTSQQIYQQGARSPTNAVASLQRLILSSYLFQFRSAELRMNWPNCWFAVAKTIIKSCQLANLRINPSNFVPIYFDPLGLTHCTNAIGCELTAMRCFSSLAGQWPIADAFPICA